MNPDERGARGPAPPPRSYFMRRPRGRKPLALGQRPENPNARCKFIGVVVKPDERLVMHAAAQADGLTLSSWLRKVALSAVGMEPENGGT